MNLLEQELSHLKTTYGFNNEEITVLTSTRRLLTFLENEFGSEISKLARVKFQTIKSFKGLESPAVVVIFSPDDFDDSGEILEQSELDKLRYVGLSRAQIVLTVFGNRSEIQSFQSKFK
jgi:superfamily I DNA/RNA helicase